DFRQEQESPTLDLRPVTQVEIFRERVMRPTARSFDARAPPDAGCSVEIEEPTGTCAGRLLNQEVPVEEHGLNARQQRVALVQMSPTRLDHSDVRVGEKLDGLLEKV